MKFQEKFTDLEKQINKQAQNSSQTYALKRGRKVEGYEIMITDTSKNEVSNE